jgi:hypothetical protein
MPRPRPGRILAIVLAVLIAFPAYSFGQVWKPRSQQKAAKAKASPTKNTRKAPAKTTSVKRSKKKVTTAKKKKKSSKSVAKKKQRRAPRDDDDFSITEENYPDED